MQSNRFLIPPSGHGSDEQIIGSGGHLQPFRLVRLEPSQHFFPSHDGQPQKLFGSGRLLSQQRYLGQRGHEQVSGSGLLPSQQTLMGQGGQAQFVKLGEDESQHLDFSQKGHLQFDISRLNPK